MASKPKPYKMRLSRLVVDKLGVKLYDRASAVVAELVANSYDADAERVTVRLPLATQLANREGGKLKDLGLVIEVEDDGHGMTPEEAQEFYLNVGRDRRQHEKQGQGPRSRGKKRPVMGRKGIGKLAPFGICGRIEVRSAGGPKTASGYVITHFIIDFEEVVKDTDEAVELTTGSDDRKFASKPGTLVRLTHFLPKKVPDRTVFHRQLARRFIFAATDFEIIVEDTKDASNEKKKVEHFEVPVMEDTKIDVSSRPVTTEDGEKLPVTGWVGFAKDAYKNEEMKGVRIFARNKIVATTDDFEQPAGFTGEFAIRSYLVGEIVADWLDKDDGEDLVKTDRQGILWDSDYGTALRLWGAQLIKELAARGRKPRRDRVRDAFLKNSNIEAKAATRFSDEAVRETAVEMAKQIGAFAAEDELEDEEYVKELSEVILSVAPHKALIEAFQTFAELVNNKKPTVDDLIPLFGKTRVAEMASYSQIAAERVRVISELEKIILDAKSDEAQLQKLIADAPWLIEPTWTVISQNQSLKTFKSAFEAFWKKRTKTEVVLAITFESKRPDFVLVNLGKKLHIVEIKASGHKFDDTDFERLHNYIEAFEDFFAENKKLADEFPDGWMIDLVADGTGFSDAKNRRLFKSLEEKKQVDRRTWQDFLTVAKNANETFLVARDEALKKKKKAGS
jgi:hypothetical protein